ncbi:MAG: TusE/DsrC/DsvC family sulfur relay protein [Chromatiales bacterium]|jgi:tRNA 2-thiouridine synthesizing protein E
MTLEVNGKTIETTDNGYLADWADWDEDIGQAIADDEGVEMTDKHWDIVRYLREEHASNPHVEPNERSIMKEMSKKWGEKLTSKDMYGLFPKMPSKQGRKIAGLPESTRKGGY